MWRMYALRKYISYLHVVIDFKRLCYYVRAVEFFVDDAAADGVSVKTDQKVEKRRAVPYYQFLIRIDST